MNIIKSITYLLLITLVGTFLTTCSSGGGGGDDSEIFDEAIFYNGARPEPQNVTFTDANNNSVTVLAYPGEIYLAVTPQTDIDDVQTIVQQFGGTILGQIPELGIYLIQVTVGNEATFISSVRTNSIVLYVSPNPVLIMKASTLVDLSDTGKTDPGDLVVALISSPDPTADVILAQLEGANTDHRSVVEDELDLITGPKNKLQVNIETSCGSLPFECSSGDAMARGLAAVIAGAEMNKQKVAVNMSYGPVYRAENQTDYNDNSKALASLEASWKAILSPLAASEWAKQGNVFLGIAAGNQDVQLYNWNSSTNKYELQNARPIDKTNVFNNLRSNPLLGQVMQNNLIFCGALWNSALFNAADGDVVQSDGELAQYSSYGTGAIFGTPHYEKGTSFVAPQCTGAAYNAWTAYPDLKSGQIEQAMATAASNNKDSAGRPVLDVEGTADEAKKLAGVCTYTYSDWSACVNNTQTRTVVSSTPAGCTGTPVITRSCTQCTYTYSDWSACQSNNQQTRTVTSSTPAGCTGTPVTTQSCTYTGPTCTYTYSDWSACQPDNTQTRTVVSSTPTGCTGTPVTTQSCTYTPPTCTYTYSDWSACQSDNTQTRTVISSTPTGCTGTPTTTQSCTYTPPTSPCCGCYFDVYCTAYGAGGCWYCHESTWSGSSCPMPSGYPSGSTIINDGACACDATLYQVCQ